MQKSLRWALAITVIIASACSDDGDTITLHQSDRDFISNASEAHLAEIELGQLASTKSNNPSVVAFGQLMMNEHQVALAELESIAEAKDATMREEINATHQQLKERLSAMNGYTFDSAYVYNQIKDHERAMALFQTEAAAGMDSELRAYASKYLPHIQMHHHKADSISTTLE